MGHVHNCACRGRRSVRVPLVVPGLPMHGILSVLLVVGVALWPAVRGIQAQEEKKRRSLFLRRCRPRLCLPPSFRLPSHHKPSQRHNRLLCKPHNLQSSAKAGPPPVPAPRPGGPTPLSLTDVSIPVISPGVFISTSIPRLP